MGAIYFKTDLWRLSDSKKGEVHHHLSQVGLFDIFFFFFLLKLFLFHPSIYSFINVSHPLPLSVHLSSLSKQTRSSCQLLSHPHPRLDQSQLVLMEFQTCYILTHLCRAMHSVVWAGWVVTETNMTFPPFNIIFQPSVFAPCDFLSSISISFLPSVIQPLSVQIIAYSAGVVGWTSSAPFATLQSHKGLSPAEK